jgi:hypothetical protein
MSNKQQTAVEQLAIALYEGGYLKGNGDEIQELVEQAKEMERKRTIQFANDYLDDDEDLTAEQFYDLTYGGNK